ncbi:MAG: MmcQ/YjbR family DNA-binding protein [Chloroflexota bacterium]|nr:MmcQ/YjbR family DNA-binding protein [Chloroflexota bacterium]
MASVVDALRRYAFTLPGAYEDHPWGESVAKVDKKVFAFFGVPTDDRYTGFTVKLPESCAAALALHFTEPTRYGLGKAGWVTVRPPDDWPVDLFRDWIDESYRAVAPKRRLRQTASAADGGSRG